MPTNKFYLHRATTGVAGTLPATNAPLSGNTATWTPGVTNGTAATPLLTNRVMDPTISAVAQTSLAYASGAVTTNQKQPLLRFVSPPLGAQTIAAQQISLFAGASLSNSASVFQWTPMLVVWRPSTGAIVGTPLNGITGLVNSNTAGTSEANSGWAGIAITAVTLQAGDVLILELWRSPTVQTMGTSYTNTLFYDGQTEQSATNNAAVLGFANSVALASDISMPNTALTGPADAFAT